MKVQGKFKMQTHFSGVVMDVAAFKVSHSAVGATALRVARARSKSIGAMEELSGEVQQRAHTFDASFSYTFELISVAVPLM